MPAQSRQRDAMAGNINPRPASHTHERHVAELLLAALALLIVIVAGGAYLYASNYHQYHRPLLKARPAILRGPGHPS